MCFPKLRLRLEHLSMPVLIDRLVLRKLFGLAILICQYLKIPDAEGQSRIMAHWACYKVGAVSGRPHRSMPNAEGPSPITSTAKDRIPPTHTHTHTSQFI